MQTKTTQEELRNLATLLIPYVKKREKVKNLKSVTISTINDVLASCGKVVLPDIKNNEGQPDDKGGKYHVCIKSLRGIEDKERCRQKVNLNQTKNVGTVEQERVPIVTLRRKKVASFVKDTPKN